MRNPLKRPGGRAPSPAEGGRPLTLVTGNGSAPAGFPDPPAVAPDPAPLAERRELVVARRESERLRSELARVEGERRDADQLAHSERAIRLELELEHASRIGRHEAHASAVLELLEAVRLRARVLAREVEALRRLSDEAVAPVRERGPRGVAAPPVVASPVVASPVVVPPVVASPAVASPAPAVTPRAPAAAAAAPPAPPAVTPDRLAAALTRLKERTPDPELGALTPARWLVPALKRLLRDHPAYAGSLLAALLPAERFDGDPVRLVRLLVCGRLRRRACRRFAGVRADGGALDAMAERIREPTTLLEIDRAGVALESEVTLALVACMIDPSWTDGRRFTVGHESRLGSCRAYLLVRAGAGARLSRRPPLGPVAATILCSEEQLLAFLAGGPAPDVTVLGESEPVALVREWVARAQRGRSTAQRSG